VRLDNSVRLCVTCDCWQLCETLCDCEKLLTTLRDLFETLWLLINSVRLWDSYKTVDNSTSVWLLTICETLRPSWLTLWDSETLCDCWLTLWDSVRLSVRLSVWLINSETLWDFTRLLTTLRDSVWLINSVETLWDCWQTLWDSD
jgi:hypothetical protein